MKMFKNLAKEILDVYFPSAAITYRRYRADRMALKEPIDTPMGFKFSGISAMEKGTFEKEETTLVRKLLMETDIVVNIGANVGYYCCLALNENKQVIAFEPMPENLRCLYKNVIANHWQDKIEIYSLALSNKTGILKIFGGGTGASLIKGWAGTPENYVEWVPSTTLNNVLGSRFSGTRCLIIVDIEGAELYMLEGASHLLSSNPKPIWLVEVSITEHQPRGVLINPNLMSTFEVFWKHGYEAWTATRVPRPVLPAEVEKIIRTGTDTLLTHDFIFIEKGREKSVLACEHQR